MAQNLTESVEVDLKLFAVSAGRERTPHVEIREGPLMVRTIFQDPNTPGTGIDSEYRPEVYGKTPHDIAEAIATFLHERGLEPERSYIGSYK